MAAGATDVLSMPYAKMAARARAGRRGGSPGPSSRKAAARGRVPLRLRGSGACWARPFPP